MIRVGPKARLQSLRPEVVIALLILDGILRKHGDVVMTISHGLDGTHTRASCHYNGCALDKVFASTLDLATKQQIFDEYKASLGQDFDVLFENPDTPNEHIHTEWQPKEAYK